MDISISYTSSRERCWFLKIVPPMILPCTNIAISIAYINHFIWILKYYTVSSCLEDNATESMVYHCINNIVCRLHLKYLSFFSVQFLFFFCSRSISTHSFFKVSFSLSLWSLPHHTYILSAHIQLLLQSQYFMFFFSRALCCILFLCFFFSFFLQHSRDCTTIHCYLYS